MLNVVVTVVNAVAVAADVVAVAVVAAVAMCVKHLWLRQLQMILP